MQVKGGYLQNLKNMRSKPQNGIEQFTKGLFQLKAVSGDEQDSGDGQFMVL